MPFSVAVSTDDRKPPDRKHPVDENLKKIYDDLIDEEIPDRFSELLRKLREQEKRK